MEQSKPKKSLLRRIFTIPHMNAFLVFVLIVFTAYTMLAPIVPAKYSKPIVQNVNNVVAGKTLTYKMESCRYVGEAVVTTITRKLVSTSDSSLVPVTLSADTVTNPVRCINVTRTVVVPFGTPAGEYQLVITGVYQVIPIRQAITVQAKSDSFHLKEATQEDIDAYNQTQAGPSVGGSSSSDPKQMSNSGASSAQTPTNVTNNTNNTTNNTTNNNTTGNGSGKEPGVVQKILENLPFGL